MRRQDGECRLSLNFDDEQFAKDANEELRPGEPAEELLPLVYAELRALAHRWFAREPPNATLQPTAIVHEAYARLVSDNDRRWKDSTHFRAVASKAMRHILIDHARRRRAIKRGGDRHKVTLHEDVHASAESPVVDMLDLDDALTELATLNERQSTIAELRFIGGMTVEEVAKHLNVSERTVKMEWKMARAWLFCRLETQG